VPLSDAALAILAALPRDGDRVFPIGDLYKLATKLRPASEEYPRGITMHGFRSSFRNWAGERTSFAREVIEQCLAHAAGDATELAYRRGDALEKRRRVMDDWAKFCAHPLLRLPCLTFVVWLNFSVVSFANGHIQTS
jgi:integrase